MREFRLGLSAWYEWAKSRVFSLQAFALPPSCSPHPLLHLLPRPHSEDNGPHIWAIHQCLKLQEGVMCSRSLFLSPSCTYTHTHWGKEAKMTSRVKNVTFFCLARWIICLTPHFASSGAIYIQYYFSTLFHPPSADKRDPNMHICL